MSQFGSPCLVWQVPSSVPSSPLAMSSMLPHQLLAVHYFLFNDVAFISASSSVEHMLADMTYILEAQLSTCCCY